MPERELKYPTITEPTQDIKSIQQSIGQIKEIVEMLTGQRGPSEYSLQEGLSKIERYVGNSTASITDLNEIVVSANFALAERVTIVEAAIDDPTTGLSAKVTNLTSATVDLANPSSIAKSVQTLSTTVGDNTADISDTMTSVNGIKATKAIKVTLNGGTGGYSLVGVQNVDGTGATFTFEINANAVINGNLTVQGSIHTDKIETNGVTRSALSTAGTYFDDVAITLRAGASVLVLGMLKGESTYNTVVGGAGIAHLRVRLGAGAFSDIESAYQIYDSTVIGGTAYFRMQTTMIQTRYIPGSDGTYTFRVISDDTATPGASIFVMETVR